MNPVSSGLIADATPRRW